MGGARLHSERKQKAVGVARLTGERQGVMGGARL